MGTRRADLGAMAVERAGADHAVQGRRRVGPRWSDDMDILTRLGCWLSGTRRPIGGWAQHRPTDLGSADGELPSQPEAPCGCGWFDSSLDLKLGLAVIEHEVIDLGLALEGLLASDGKQLH